MKDERLITFVSEVSRRCGLQAALSESELFSLLSFIF